MPHRIEEDIKIPDLKKLQEGTINCPQCLTEIKVDKALEIEPCPQCGTSIYIPLTLKDYVLYKPIGGGGSGKVYKALKKGEGRDRYAIKLLHRSKKGNLDFEKSIMREAAAGAAVGRHQHIVEVVEYGQEGNESYIIFPFIDGERLDGYIQRKKRISEKRAMGILLQILAAEEHICSRGYLFRDLKPENIFLENNGNVKIFDYGLCIPIKDAKIHGDNVPDEIEGSPFYIPPERILGTSEGEFSEIYSLGMILFHMLKGRTYFTSTEIHELIAKHVDKLRTESVGKHLSHCNRTTIAIIDKMIKREPELRYQDFVSLKKDIAVIEKEVLKKPLILLLAQKK